MIDWNSLLPKPVAHPELVSDDALMGPATLAVAAIYQRWGAILSESALPTVPDKMMALARLYLVEQGLETAIREEALAVVRHGGRFLDLAKQELPEDLALELATHLNPALLVEVVRVGWNGRRDLPWRDWADVLELLLEDTRVKGATFSPLVDTSMLDPELEGAVRIANEFRYLRSEEYVQDQWAMWSKLQKHKNSPGGRLFWTVSLPGSLRSDVPELVGGVDLVLTMEHFARFRGAQPRRREAVKRIAAVLNQGKSVLWMANSSTVESRRAVIAAGREAHADVTGIFLDSNPELLRTQLSDEGWDRVPERAFERGLAVLEGPRPHEAESVLVLRDGKIAERWVNTVYEGWEARILG